MRPPYEIALAADTRLFRAPSLLIPDPRMTEWMVP